MSGSSSDDEFPLLSDLGLYAADILGDGNCLFNALSDQIYGDQNQHSAIRARVIQWMRDHPDDFKQFLHVNPGGGTRRNPKRKNAGAYSSPANSASPSAAEIERAFEKHLQTMAQGGTYGDNMEISAFAAAFNVDVKIYLREYVYIVAPPHQKDDTPRPMVHIAYHTWEHYSSIRNLAGPKTGLPQVSPKALSPDEEAQQTEKLAQSSPVQTWQIDAVHKALPFLADRPTIKRALEVARGDFNAAVSRLMDEQEFGSSSSQQNASSIEREQASDDDFHSGPKKKQDRRLSRHTKTKSTTRAPYPSALVLEKNVPTSAETTDSETSSKHGSSVSSPNTRPTSVDEDILKRDNKCIPLDIKAPVRPSSLSPRRHLKGLALPLPKVGPHGRISARDNRAMKKFAQKAARKERQQAALKDANSTATAAITATATDGTNATGTTTSTTTSATPIQAGLAFRGKNTTETRPAETLRTLFI